MSFKYELERIGKEVDSDKLNIIAKSLGTGVTAQLLMRKTNEINKIVLCGIPSINPANAEIFASAFLDFPPDKIIVFQNAKDPLASYEEVREFVKRINPSMKVVKKPAHTHNYPYFEDFQAFLKD